MENKSLSDVLSLNLRVVIISSNVSEPDWHVLERIRMGSKEIRTGWKGVLIYSICLQFIETFDKVRIK